MCSPIVSYYLTSVKEDGISCNWYGAEVERVIECVDVLYYVHTTELFHGTVPEQFQELFRTVPGTVLRKVHTAQLQLFQESIIIII